MPAVFDSGVWISALKYGGVPYQALRSAYHRDCIVCCAAIREEVERILNAKFGWYTQDTVIAMDRFLEGQPDTPLTGAVRGVCRDPNDDMVLECALVAGAAHIVSGDKDLLSLKTYLGIPILTARDYLNQFGKAPTLP